MNNVIVAQRYMYKGKSKIKRTQEHHEKQERVKGQKEKKRKGFRHTAKTPITTGLFTLNSPEPKIKIQSLV